MPGRKMEAESYRYGFTGHEKENEYAEGIYSTETRLLDTRIGRWFGVDELFAKYPGWSSYNYCKNNPLKYIDPDGRDVFIDGPEQDLAFEEVQSLCFQN